QSTVSPDGVHITSPLRPDQTLLQPTRDADCSAVCASGTTQSESRRTYCGLTDRDQFVTATVAGIFLLCLGCQQYSRMYIPVNSPQYRLKIPIAWRVDLNTAEWDEFTLLDRIGPVLARRIATDRQTNGPFHSIEDLQRVEGIGPRTIERNRQRLTVTATSLRQTRIISADAAE
ncbi:MAG: helix-hairpin-helix domain-containing protein, partial [Planctomycetaceae bacterium]